MQRKEPSIQESFTRFRKAVEGLRYSIFITFLIIAFTIGVLVGILIGMVMK